MTPEQIQRIIDGLNAGGRWAFGLAVRQAHIDAAAVLFTTAIFVVAMAWLNHKRKAEEARPDGDSEPWHVAMVGLGSVMGLVLLIAWITVLPTALLNPQWYAIRSMLP